jgi:valyl-tRNA synthetase
MASAAWPDACALREYAGDAAVLTTAAEAIAAVRKAKSQARLSMRAEVAGVLVTAERATLDRFAAASGDVRAAGRIAAVRLRDARGDLKVEVTL